jgi:acyl-CoA synthetase (AMP-forming)/AMP-acid ligase II
MTYRSPLPAVEIPGMPLTAYVLAEAARPGDKPALIDAVSGRVLTYEGLDSAVRSLAGGLAAAGFAKGDVLALMAPNMPEFAVVFHAAALAGGIITMINPVCTDAEVHSQLRDSGARLLVTIPPFVALALAGS